MAEFSLSIEMSHLLAFLLPFHLVHLRGASSP